MEQRQANNNQPLSKSWLQGLFAFSDQAVVSLVSALTTVIVGRACTKEELGVFSFATSLLWRALGIPMALIWSPYAARVAHLSPKAVGRYAGSSAAMAWGLAVAQAVVLAAAFLATKLAASVWDLPNWIAPLLLAMAPLLFGATLREHARRTCIADFRSHYLLAIDLPIGLLQLAALLLLWHYDWLSAATALVTVGVAALLSVVWFVVELPSLRIRWRMVRGHFLSNLNFGGWLLAIAVAWLLCDLTLRAILTWFHGIDAVGTFASAYIIVSLINPVVVAATTFSRSLAARIYAQEGHPGLLRFSLLGTVAALVLALAVSGVLAVWGEQIVLLIFNKAYADGYVVGAVSLGFCLQAVVIPIDASQMALEKGRNLFVVSVLRVAVVFLAGIPLVWWQGAAGIGWTTALQSVLVVIVNWLFFLRQAK